MQPDSFDIKSFLKTLTTRPGIYCFFNANNDMLYVGKARNLKKRVSNYFTHKDIGPKTTVLVQQIHHIEVTVTQTENEALILECHFIKKHHPRYNVLLRDDKSYPYIYLSTQLKFPRLERRRGARQQDPGRYFGPYPNASAARHSVQLLQKLFQIRPCSEAFFNARTRPCLQYQLKRCTAPCVNYIDPVTYQQDVQNAILFLEGKNQNILTQLAQRMDEAAQQLNYEQAARYRDQIAQLRQIQAPQYISSDKGDVDVIAIATQNDWAALNVMQVQAGQVIGARTHLLKVPYVDTPAAILTSFIGQYYLTQLENRLIPPQILLNLDCQDHVLLEKTLSEAAGKPVAFIVNARQQRAQWVKMADINASEALSSHLAHHFNYAKQLKLLQTALDLPTLPRHLECFDISHTQGTSTMASCVVFSDQGPMNQLYRRFNIDNITPGDDYAAMRQVLLRRYSRAKKETGIFPDIIFIDGGRGQLHQAEVILTELNITGITLIGIAKGEGRKPGLETLFISGQVNPLQLATNSPALHLIQHIRDEAHRFAITGHRKQRARTGLTSALLTIPGIGNQRRKQLLQHFGGLMEVKRASVEELAKVPGISQALAQRIYSALKD